MYKGLNELCLLLCSSPSANLLMCSKGWLGGLMLFLQQSVRVSGVRVCVSVCLFVSVTICACLQAAEQGSMIRI